MDQYIVKKCSDGRGIFFYYKNDKLHREAGPAIVYRSNRRKFITLIDEDLYKQEVILENVPENYETNHIVENPVGLCPEITVAVYYLEGEPYTKNDFEKLKTIIDLNKELGNELPQNNMNSQNTKVKL